MGEGLSPIYFTRFWASRNFGRRKLNGGIVAQIKFLRAPTGAMAGLLLATEYTLNSCLVYIDRREIRRRLRPEFPAPSMKKLRPVI